MKQSNKRKRLRGSKKGVASKCIAPVEQKVPSNFLEAFGSVSLDEVVLNSGDTCRNPYKSAEERSTVSFLEDQSTTCSSSSGNFDFSSSSSRKSGSNATEAAIDTSDFLHDEISKKSKPKMKKIVASAGTVSCILGKDYVRSVPKKCPLKMKNEDNFTRQEAEEFLYSVLGDDTLLSFALVSDVFCQCGYNLDKALDVLLELSSSSKSGPDTCKDSTGAELADNSNLNPVDKTSGSSYYSSVVDFQGNASLVGNIFSNSTWPASGGSQTSTSTENSEELPHKLLESLFHMPTPKTSGQDPDTMNWRSVVKKIRSLSKGFEPVDYDSEKLSHAKGNEYQMLRDSANHHYDSMKSYYRKATSAFSNGDKAYAAYLSEQGRIQKKMAREADEKGSQDIFAIRNKSIRNMITIDLHGQHVKQAMNLLKLHLLFGACVRSVRSFRVITGCGPGKSNLKSSVIDLLKKEGISWSEENPGSLLIQLGNQTAFGFLDSGSDSE